jgi:excisionase family DNA binding protein
MPGRLLRVADAAKYLSISRAKLYELLKSEDIESIKIGKSRRITTEALDAYVARLQKDQAADSPAK